VDVKLWSRGEEVKQLLSAAPTRRARSQPAGPGQEEEEKKEEEEVVGFVGPATERPVETADVHANCVPSCQPVLLVLFSSADWRSVAAQEI